MRMNSMESQCAQKSIISFPSQPTDPLTNTRAIALGTNGGVGAQDWTLTGVGASDGPLVGVDVGHWLGAWTWFDRRD